MKQQASLVHQVEEVAQLLDSVAAIAPSKMPVLLLGPRSTGIDLVARALHTCSPREARPFITARCKSSLYSSLESQLLGTAPRSGDGKRKPAKQRPGYIESANSGTLFVDQIQNTTPQVQLEILRLLTDQEYVDPGEGGTHPVDVRLIASAWTDLESRAEAGRFRADLYARLSGVSLELRRGSSDKERFLQVVELFREEEATESATHIPAVILRALRHHEWSEKVLALQLAIRESAAHEAAGASAETVLFGALREMGQKKSQYLAQHHLQAVALAVERCVETYEFFNGHLYDTLLVQLQRTLIQKVMIQCNGTLSLAASVLGVSSNLLEAKLQELRIDRNIWAAG